MSEVVPFGKYRGQPIEVMHADSSYMTWLRLQQWAREQYPSLLIIQQQTEEASPAHNYLQNKFLDDEFNWKFVNAMKEKDWREWAKIVSLEANEIYIEPVIKVAFEVPSMLYETIRNGKFHDVIFHFIVDHYIEVKPIIGDDYPNVLRQIKQAHTFTNRRGQTIYANEHKKILFVGEYNGVGATEEQFVKIFAKDNIKVIFLRNVE